MNTKAKGNRTMPGKEIARGLAPEAQVVGSRGLSRPGLSRRLTRRAATGLVSAGVVGASTPLARIARAQAPVATPVSADETNQKPEPVQGGSVRLVRPGSNLLNFNPAAFAQDPQIPRSYLEPLVRSGPQSMAPIPWLAHRWVWSGNGRELRFAIREGVVWHDGAPFDASDAVFSMSVYRDDPASAVSGLFSLVETIDVLSDLELRVRFVERDANWLFNAATLPIFSRRQHESFWQGQGAPAPSLSNFDWSESAPLGTGPWKIDEWDESSVRFSAFADHWRQAPWLDELVVSVQPGARDRLVEWRRGGSKILWPASLGEAEANAEKAEEIAAPAASVMFAAFNFANPLQPSGSLWADLNVRRAASMAINRERYASEVFDGAVKWESAGTVAQPWANDGSVLAPALNRDGASVLLAEAGWIDYDGDGIREDAAGTPLRPVAIVSMDHGSEIVAVLARVARDLADVGIDLVVEVLPAHEFDQRWIVNRDYDLIAYAYDLLPGFTDYDLYGSAWDIRTNPAGWNPGGYSNAEADSTIAEFLSAISMERQRAALSRLQHVVNEDLFALWFGFPMDRILIAEGIEGFEPDIAWQTAQTWTIWRSDLDR